MMNTKYGSYIHTYRSGFHHIKYVPVTGDAELIFSEAAHDNWMENANNAIINHIKGKADKEVE